MLEATAATVAYTRGGKQAFEADAMLRDAVVARLIQSDKLAHRYWTMDIAIVWEVVESELPKLVAAVRELLAGRLPATAARRPRRRNRRS